MRLTDLIGAKVAAAENIDITGLTADSREVKPGYLFAALGGTKQDGAAFVDDAISRGAVAVLAASGRLSRDIGVPLIEDPQPRSALARYAARFFGRQPATIAAVTGTSGKTSVVDFTRQIWTAMGLKAASLGTLGVIASELRIKLAHTTPDPVTLHQALHDIAVAGVDHLALEASSHGLDQARLDGIQLKAAAFTNLSRDHLDYHPDAESYFRAKASLFDAVLPAEGVAVLPQQGEFAEKLQDICRKHGLRVITFGEGAADVRLLARRPHIGGQILRIAVGAVEAEADLPLIGAFQASNVLCAFGLVLACGGEAGKAARALGEIVGVPGRLQPVAQTDAGARIYVDYAHKPDALENALRALRPHTGGRLVVIFGCGGDRDTGKRPEMGHIAAALADRVIVTDDNPRSEDAAAIRQEVLAGCPDAEDIGDRREAIRAGASRLGTGDVLLIAGKGHEQGQEIAGKVRPFDDAEEARRAVRELAGGGDA